MGAGMKRVTFAEVVGAAQRRLAALPGELAGYLALGVADQTGGLPLRLDLGELWLDGDGRVLVAPACNPCTEGQAEANLRRLLRCLLSSGCSVTPALLRAGTRSESIGMRGFVRELETALIPVNRSAARRALARLSREVAHAATLGELVPGEVRVLEPTPRPAAPLADPCEYDVNLSELEPDRALEPSVEISVATALPPETRPQPPARSSSSVIIPDLEVPRAGELPAICQPEPPLESWTELPSGDLVEVTASLPLPLFVSNATRGGLTAPLPAVTSLIHHTPRIAPVAPVPINGPVADPLRVVQSVGSVQADPGAVVTSDDPGDALSIGVEPAAQEWDQTLVDAPVAEPEVAVAEPEVAVAEPEVAVAEPEVAVAEPEVAVAEPEVAVAEPEVAVAEPEVAVAEPEVAVAEPEVAEPEAAVAELDAEVAVAELDTLATEADELLLEGDELSLELDGVQGEAAISPDTPEERVLVRPYSAPPCFTPQPPGNIAQLVGEFSVVPADEVELCRGLRRFVGLDLTPLPAAAAPVEPPAEREPCLSTMKPPEADASYEHTLPGIGVKVA